MKLTKLFPWLAIALLTVGCKPSNPEMPTTLELEQTSVTLDKLASSQEVVVKSSTDTWLISIEPKEAESWLTATKTAKGLKVDAKPNYAVEERTADVVLSLNSAGIKETLKVTQFGAEKTIIIADTEKEKTIDANGGLIVIPVDANGTDWKIEIANTPDWIKAESALDENNQKVLKITVSKIESGTEGRTANIAVKHGDNTAYVKVDQTGLLKFSEFYIKPNMTVADAESWAKSKGLVEDTAKRYTWFENIQTTRREHTGNIYYLTKAQNNRFLIYEVNKADKSKIISVQLCSGEQDDKNKNLSKLFPNDINPTFNLEDVEEYLKSMGYKHYESEEKYETGGNSYKPLRGHAITWYKVTDNLMYSALVLLMDDQDFSNRNGFDAMGARIIFKVVDLTEENGGVTIFPAGNANKLLSTDFKFAEIEKYEKERGRTLTNLMSDDGIKKMSAKSNVPGYTDQWEYATFISADYKNAKDGELIYSTYFFMIPGLEKYLEEHNTFGKNDDGTYSGYEYNDLATADKALMFGQRVDTYKGYKAFFTLNPYTGAWHIKQSIIIFAQQLGYKLAKSDFDQLGWTVFIRGEDEVVFITPGQTATQFQFYRSKYMFKLAQGNLE